MKILIIKGHKVTIFFSYNGTELYINNSRGEQIYGHKVSGNVIARAEQIINEQ